MNIKNIISEEVKSFINEELKDSGVVRLYHRISGKRVDSMPELIKSVIENGLQTFDNGEVGSTIWFSDNYNDYAKNGEFVVALDFDLSTNGHANNEYELIYDGQNAYAYKDIPFDKLIVIKIPVFLIHNHYYSNKEIIEGGFTPESVSDVNGLVVYEDIFNKYVQPHISTPDFISKLNPEKVTLVNVMGGGLNEFDDSSNMDNSSPLLPAYGDRLRSISEETATKVLMSNVSESDANKLIEWWNANTDYQHFKVKRPVGNMFDVVRHTP